MEFRSRGERRSNVVAATTPSYLQMDRLNYMLEQMMRRTSVMTLGMVLIFLGVQLYLVNTYVLTPRFSNFLMEHSTHPDSPSATSAANGAYNSPYYQASYPGGSARGNSTANQQVGAPQLGGPKSVSTPRWLCWPVLFLGTVVFLHGLSIQAA